jgi:hypothetical protein
VRVRECLLIGFLFHIKDDEVGELSQQAGRASADELIIPVRISNVCKCGITSVVHVLADRHALLFSG